MPAGAASPPGCSKRPSRRCARPPAAGPAELDAWLGVCIGPRAFEVGADVLEAFGARPATAAIAGSLPAQPGKWLADLAGLARDRLAAAGVERVGAAAGCAFEDASRFFSYRRDRVTGRMAAAVWIARRPAPAEASSARRRARRRAGVPRR